MRGLPEGQVLAIADKADTVAGMFGLGMEPTGSKDPFALRRAANGIVKTLAESDLFKFRTPAWGDCVSGCRGERKTCRETREDTRWFLCGAAGVLSAGGALGRLYRRGSKAVLAV